MREPTNEERAKESSFLFANATDVAATALLILMAIASGSLTMLGEAVRAQLMLITSFYAYWVMRAVHRERLTRYEYGVGKLEQFVWLVVGLSLVIGALWVASRVITTVFSSEPPASPLALTLAAMVNAINLVVNFLGWYVMHVAAREDAFGVFGAQLRAKVTMLLSSLFLQWTLTVAALAKDDAIALTLDALGAIFVVTLMLYKGWPMIARALPDLLDAPATEELRELILATLASVLPEDHIFTVRTRRCGPTTFARVTVSDAAFASVAALHEATAAVTDGLRRTGADVDLMIVPLVEGGPPDADDEAIDALPAAPANVT